MRENFTDIRVVLDRSGSMSVIRDDTIGSFNSFLEEQKKQPGEANFKLIQFDEKYEPEETVSLKDALPLTRERFIPRGWTALNDAIGRTIVQAGQEFEAMSEEDRPGKVILMILTDGAENSSREYTSAQVKAMIEHQQTKYSWMVIFLGANIDAQQVGSTYGISKGMSMTFGANSAGTTSTMTSLSNTLGTLRRMDMNTYNMTACAAAAGSYDAFSDEDRVKAMGDDQVTVSKFKEWALRNNVGVK